MELREYQKRLVSDILFAWERNRNVIAVLPTGGGKTVVLSHIIACEKSPTCVIAHRQELVTQISLALARCGVSHRVIGPPNVIRAAVGVHMDELGVRHVNPNARCAVAGVDTLVRRSYAWFKSVKLWVIDEAHHVLLNNKWGSATSLFPNARGLGVTATPIRADRKGLGRSFDGVMDALVEGPTMRELITSGYLCDYRIFAPPSDLDLSEVKVSRATGDYNRDGMVKAVRTSKVIGDVVDHYLKIAPLKLGITFATDVRTATDIADKFKGMGIPASVISAKTPDAERVKLIREFRDRKLLQLVNVDLFGEGFDLPALEVVSMARPTQSFGLFCQQFGRSLRPMQGKPNAIIIDHVGNIINHGLPDAMHSWTLEGKRRSGASECKIPVTTCVKCYSVYERNLRECPYCDHYEPPAKRSSIKHVSGDLFELDEATLLKLREGVGNIDKDPEVYRSELVMKGAPVIGQLTHVKRHVKNQESQRELRDTIAMWAGYQRHEGWPDHKSYRTFYFKFGIDVLSAQALSSKDAIKLKNEVERDVFRRLGRKVGGITSSDTRT